MTSRRLFKALASLMLIGGAVVTVQSSATAALATTKVRAIAGDGSAKLNWAIVLNGHQLSGVYIGRAATAADAAWESSLLTPRTGLRTFPNLRNGTTYSLYVQPVIDGRRVAKTSVTVTPKAAVTDTPTSPVAPVLFEDDFSGSAGQSFDRTKWQDWSSCTYNPSAAYGKIKCGDNETLDGEGHLQIPATPNSGSALSTATKFSFTYGEVSAWIKVPAADGYWPAFWTLNNATSGPSHPVVGELDIMEQYTTWDNLYHRSAKNWYVSGKAWGGGDAMCGNVDLTAAFHKYTVRVEPGKTTFYFDGTQCGQSITREMGDGKAYAFGPDMMDPNWLILNVAVGGASGQQEPAATPATMLVDRVEVRGL